MLGKKKKRQRSQAMPEFALVAPVFFLIIFGVFDFGRGILAYIAIQHAANEAARVAVQGEKEILAVGSPYLPPCTLLRGDTGSNCPVPATGQPEYAGAIDAAIRNTGDIKLVQASCPNGQTTNWTAGIPAGQGRVFLSDPSSGWGAGKSFTNPPSGPVGPNGAGSDSQQVNPVSGCWPDFAAGGNKPLQATVIYHFSPLTPVIGGLVGSNITLIAYTVYVTEY
jgi:TadE-like protein